MKMYENSPRRLGFYLLSIIILLNTSCKKDPPLSYCEEHPEDCVNIQEVKDYIYFDVGSWWLYEEETTLERDCVYVVEAYNDPNSYNFDVKTNNSLSDWTLHYWPRFNEANSDCHPSGLIHDRCVNIYRSKYKPGDFEGESYCFFFLLREGEFIYTTGGYPYITDNKLSVDKEMYLF